MKRSLSTTLFAATAAIGFTACTTSDEDSIPDEDQVVSAIEQPNGGLDMEDEAPMFDDPVFSAADLENDAAETDALEADPATRQLFDTAGAVRHRVVVLWGELPPDRT